MEQELKARLDAQDAKLEAIYKTAERTRKYFVVAMWVVVLSTLVPLIGFIVVAPIALTSYMSAF